MLVWYVQYLSRSLKSHSSLLSYLAGVKKLHRILGYVTDGFRGCILYLTLAGLKRINSHAVRQALPMTPVILKKMYQQLNLSLVDDAVFWSIALSAFFLIFRKSNLIPDTKWGFNCNKQLRWCDIVFTQFNAVVGIRWAKNHQFSRELLTFPLPKIPSSCLCPVSALKRVIYN